MRQRLLQPFPELIVVSRGDSAVIYRPVPMGNPTTSTSGNSTSGGSILTSTTGAVLTITLNRPEKLNAVTEGLSTELCAALKAAEADSSVRCIVLRGAGKGFCAGQDLGLAPHDGTADLGGIVQRVYNPIVTLLTSIPKPVIAAVHGVAAGAGANLALACDFVIASSDASFIQSFIHVGLIPDSAGTFFLPRTIGLARATALTMLGEKVSGSEAEAMGMIYRAVVAERLESETQQLANRLAALPTLALGVTKQLLRSGLSRDLQSQLQAESAGQRAAGASTDFKEGVRAFLEKRPPQFQGR